MYVLAALLTACHVLCPVFYPGCHLLLICKGQSLCILDIGPMLVWTCVVFPFSAIHLLTLTLQVRAQGTVLTTVVSGGARTRARVSVLRAQARAPWGTATSLPSKYASTEKQTRSGTETRGGDPGGLLKVTPLVNSITWFSLIR